MRKQPPGRPCDGDRRCVAASRSQLIQLEDQAGPVQIHPYIFAAGIIFSVLAQTESRGAGAGSAFLHLIGNCDGHRFGFAPRRYRGAYLFHQHHL